MGLLGKIFTWWDGATIGTLLYSWRKGEQVGEDAVGNRYFRSRDGARRWVIYNGSNDASRVAPVDKLSVVLVALFGLLFLGEALNWKNWLGICLVFAGVLLLAMRD